ncbi:LysE family translocator [Halomonas sabkhae]|uniref:LysE family translocator n=1 Tax=Halomonas sabkhae TaxID=626223 RepID=UPI0025B592EC|nr:LysE family translocator [Halomonas sabkhae]MDN3525279.1 LysE family translocator [Halomonas sabkhae]
MDLDALLTFLPACFALNMAFGPNNLMAMTNAARRGLGIAVSASLGRVIAFVPMITIAGIGLGAVLQTSAWLFLAIKWLGAAYLIWLGVKLLRTPAPQADQESMSALSWWRLARQEFVVAAGNPKAILIFTAFFPQFVDPAHYTASFALVGAIFLVLEIVAVALYATLGLGLGRWLSNRILPWFNRVSGVAMMGFGAMLAFMKRPSLEG